MPQRAFFSKGIKEGLGAENVYIVVYLRNRILAVSIPVCTVMELWRKKVFCVCVFFFKLVNMLGILWRLPFRYCDRSLILWWFSNVLYVPDKQIEQLLTEGCPKGSVPFSHSSTSKASCSSLQPCWGKGGAQCQFDGWDFVEHTKTIKLIDHGVRVQPLGMVRDREGYHDLGYFVFQLIHVALLLGMFWSVLMSEAWILQVDLA